VLRLAEAFFIMISGLSAAVAVRDTRRARSEDRADRWRREAEGRLDTLADAVVALGEAAIMWRETRGEGPNYEAAQLRLHHALIDALNPWIDVARIIDLAEASPQAVTAEFVETALSDIANSVERVRNESSKSHRQRKRELKQLLR
jgi:hypothetical protein